jgi:hypothetical protein
MPEENAIQDYAPTDMDDEQEETGSTSNEPVGVGVYGPWWKSPERTWLKEDLDVNILNGLINLRQLCSRSDIAARRFEVEQTWEVQLFDRGYQHLTGRKGGGFDLPGEDTRWGPTAQINRSNLLNCNILSKTKDILVGALCRETPRVQFLPSCPSNNPEVTAAQIADKFKYIYQRNNNLREKMREIADYFCTSDRVVTLTAYWADATNYGYVEDREDPVSPETETTDALQQILNGLQEREEQDEQDEGDGEPDRENQEETPEEPAKASAESVEPKPEETGSRTPMGMELTWVFDKLSNKVPITSDSIRSMPWIQLFRDWDEAYVKGMFPFAKDRIKPEGTDSAEIELDRIARLNTNLAIQGKYVTGDSLQRLCTVCWTFLRPSMFYCNEIKKEIQEELCEMFPDGCLIVCAGSEFMFARNCAMNDHVAVAHALSGKGQNRRALLTNIMPIQKRLNDWMDLMGDFFVRTVPKRYYDQTAFDIELIQSQDNTPGGSIPFIARPGVALTELMGTDPIVQNQPAMAEFIKWFEGELNDDISGALASLYGGATDQLTVGGAEIQRNQALGRLNGSWNAIQELFAETHRQAVKAAAQNRPSDIDESVYGVGRVTVEIAKMKGNVLCYPEYDASFPEDSEQKLLRYEELWKTAPENPLSMALLKSPKNMKVAKDVLRFNDLEIPGAMEYEKQQGEFEILIKTGPVPNPEIMKIQKRILQHRMEINAATETMKQGLPQGTLGPEHIQQVSPQMDMLEQQEQMMATKLKQLEKDAPEVSTVPVAEDKSENHAVEAAACYDWMNSPEGRRYKHGSPEDRDVFKNIYLHWKEHMAMDEKLNPKQAQFKSEGINFSGDLTKLPGDISSQVLAAAGFQVKPTSFQQKVDDETRQTIKQRTAPKVLTKLTRS